MVNPHEQTVAELREYVDDVDDEDELDEIQKAESDGKNRKTAHDAIEERRQTLTADADDDADEDDQPGVLTGEEAYDAAGDDYTGRLSVRNVDRRGKHVAGYSFEAGETKHIPNTPAVQKALRSGELQYITE